MCHGTVSHCLLSILTFSPKTTSIFLRALLWRPVLPCFSFFSPPSVPFIFSRGGSKRRGLWRRMEPDSVSPRSFLCFLLSETLLWKNPITTSECWMFSCSSHRKLVPTCPPLTQCYPQANVIYLSYSPSHECFPIFYLMGFSHPSLSSPSLHPCL